MMILDLWKVRSSVRNEVKVIKIEYVVLDKCYLSNQRYDILFVN